ncbi:MAG: hypothetical protein KDC54_21495, partial [Lewinella sp.]|nr:hypothetical protein [Lewinella sp.]
VELPYHFNQQEYDLRFQWNVPRGWILSGGWQTIWSDDAEGRFVENAWQGHLSKGWPHLLLTASGGYADFTVGERWQYGGSLVIYPRANTDWYWRAAATLLSGDEQQTWWTQQLGWRVAERAWVEGMFEWGEIAHYQDWTQGFLYNIAEPVHNRLAINWQQGFGKEHFLLLQYMWEKKASLTSGQTYRHHALTIGLSFNLR